MNKATIDLLSDRFIVTTKLGSREVIWREIDEIATYNIDAYTHEIMCLGFRVSPNGAWVEVSEEDAGFGVLVRQIVHHFPSVPEDWYERVTEPPVDPSYCIIWLRDV